MFRFKEFEIEDDRCAMKVGTDGVLLGAWVNLGSVSRAMDIGTGSGLIAIMLAQRSLAQVVGVDIDDVSQAKENAQKTRWAERLDFVQSPVQEYQPEDGFDLIVSNPPYFVDALRSPSAQRSQARHTDSLPFEELVQSVVRMLKPNGRFALILPVAEFQLFEESAKEHLYCVRRTDVMSYEGRAAVRVLAEFSLCEGILSIDELIIREQGHEQYTEQYRDLTREFYLKF